MGLLYIYIYVYIYIYILTAPRRPNQTFSGSGRSRDLIGKGIASARASDQSMGSVPSKGFDRYGDLIGKGIGPVSGFDRFMVGSVI